MLTSWAADGSLGAAAREALRLDGVPAQLTALISQWAAGDISVLPPIEVVEGSVLPGAAGAYAISTGTIYLNGDWLDSANEDRVIAVLTEELGHHLDGLLNVSDTPGDEGELFSGLVLGRASAKDRQTIFTDNDFRLAVINDCTLAIEQAILFRFPIVAPSYQFSSLQDYGSRNLPGTAADFHNGIDFAGASFPVGTSVYASAAGTASLFVQDGVNTWFGSNGVGGTGKVSYGKYIKVSHGDGYQSLYAHLDSFAISDGSRVEAGQLIGRLGNTGYSSAPHLHFEISVSPYGGTNTVDPLPLLQGWTTSPTPTPPPPGTDSRLVLPIFDPAYYLATYADVRNAYGSSNFLITQLDPQAPCQGSSVVHSY